MTSLKRFVFSAVVCVILCSCNSTALPPTDHQFDAGTDQRRTEDLTSPADHTVQDMTEPADMTRPPCIWGQDPSCPAPSDML